MKISDCLKKKKENKKEKKAYGLIDSIINKLPEIHIPGYQYCGPGTKLEKRLSRGDPGINKLDAACKDHDIAYSNVSDSKERHKADKVLTARAFKRIYSSDAKLDERAAAALVTGLVGAKIGLSKIGLGLSATDSKMAMKRKSRRTKKPRQQRARRQRRSIRKKTKTSSRRKGVRKQRRTARVLKVAQFGGSGFYLKPYQRR